MQLTQLPGIVEATAKYIIDYREEVNGFKTKDELKNVRGIGDKKYEKIKDLVTLGAKSDEAGKS